MFRVSLTFGFACALIASIVTVTAQAGDSFGTAFTYQARLLDGGVAVDGTVDLRFRLYTSSGGSTQVGTEQIVLAVPASDGALTVTLDFGSAAFVGDTRWLEIDVRSPAGSGSYTTLSPRQPMLPVPYAIFAAGAPWGGLTGVPASFPPSSHSASLITSGTIDDARLSGNVVRSGPNQTITGEKYFTANVGIGTTTPSQTLEAWGDVVFGGGLGNATDGASEFISMRGQSAQWSFGVQNAGSPGTTGFFIGTNASDFNSFYLDRSGRLGMGTSAPTADLHIADVGAVSVHLEADTNDSGEADQPSLRMSQDGGTVFADLGYFDSENDFSVRTTGGEILLQPAQNVQVQDPTGVSSTFLTTDPSGVGRMWTLGPNGQFNVQITNHSSSDDHGAVAVYDDAGVIQALMGVGVSGDGFISATVKNFRMDNPRDADTEIVYACIEGPEAAAYVRGTAALVNGAAVVQLPAHFTDVASEPGMTVQLTPRSASSRGLAVVQRSTSAFEVRELMNGDGTYEFDWEVKAVRKGFETYEVIQPRLRVGGER